MKRIFNKTFGKQSPIERVIENGKGDFVGLETGKIYRGEEYYASPTLRATVVSIDEEQKNGMIHLEPGSEYHLKKQNFIGCTMTFRRAHNFGELTVYQCIETGEYYNQNELKVL